MPSVTGAVSLIRNVRRNEAVQLPMGMESFGLMMVAHRQTSTDAVEKAIRAYPSMHHVRSSIIGAAYEYFDERHLFEVLLHNPDTQVEFDVSARFALCSPDSIEVPFTAFLKWAISQWQPSVIWFLTSRFRSPPLTPKDYEAFLASGLRAEIQAMREYWQTYFGAKRGAVRVEAAWAFAGILSAELSAAPNGSPATSANDSGATEGPPSVS